MRCDSAGFTRLKSPHPERDRKQIKGRQFEDIVSNDGPVKLVILTWLGSLRAVLGSPHRTPSAVPTLAQPCAARLEHFLLLYGVLDMAGCVFFPISSDLELKGD